MTTPAEELRAAAEKLRQDAEAARLASPLPWFVTDEHVVRCADESIVADRSSTTRPQDRADLPYIAAMHPGVGTALAKWLISWGGIELEEFGPLPEDAQHALAVARAINGGAQ